MTPEKRGKGDLEIYWRYQVVRSAVDFGAALCFVIGSAFFLFASTVRAADWLFLVGSILFAVKPTIEMIRSLHLRRLATTRDTAPAERVNPIA